jgi:hypothetical protein
MHASCINTSLDSPAVQPLVNSAGLSHARPMKHRHSTAAPAMLYVRSQTHADPGLTSYD